MEKFCRFSNAAFICVLMGVLLSAFYQQFTHHLHPCPLCFLQRLAMLGISMGLFLNLRLQMNPMHYGFSLLSAIFGGSVSLRQIALHVCPGFPIFGQPVLGLSLYTWAFLVFVLSGVSIGILLMISPKEQEIKKMNTFELFVAFFLLAMIISNCVITYVDCFFGPCQDVPWPQPSAKPLPFPYK